MPHEPLLATPEQKKGSLELLVLSVLASEPRHGYEIGRLIELRSAGHLQFRISTLYPVLYRMENRGWIQGRWVERPGERRRCYYHLTEAGKRALSEQHDQWRAFAAAVNLVVEGCHG
jgi:PadR family transcriptional regulator, regulatory protein PadR